MPVRVKSRALTLQRPDELEREWDNLSNSLTSLLLANPQFSKVVLLNAEQNRRLSIRLGAISMPQGRISHDHGEFDLKRIGSIFVQSGLLIPQSLGFWHEMSASVSDLTIRGAISLRGSPTWRSQFISLGKEPVLSRNRSNILYNEVNRLFALSDFGGVEGALSHGSSVTNPASSSKGHDAQSNVSTRSWAKPVNKWPMFYIRIDAKASIRMDDNGSGYLPESNKSIQRIVDVLGAMVREFLKQHNLRPRDSKQRTFSSDQNQSILSKESQSRRSSRGAVEQTHLISSTEEAFTSRVKIPSFPRVQAGKDGQNFSNWSRTKTAKDLIGHSPKSSHAASGMIKGKNPLSILPSDGPSSFTNSQEFTIHPGPPSKRLCGEMGNTTESQSADSRSDKMITWIDPHTKLAYMINPRTGQTMNSRKSLATQESGIAVDETLPKRPAPSFWIENMLGAWDNPIFNRTEMPIPNLDAGSAGQQNANTAGHDCFKNIQSLDTAQVAKYRGKLQRHALETAEVIAQVDKKFILAKLHTTPVNLDWGGTPNDVLLLIDQHAADERCRLEQLFGEMFVSPAVGENLESGRCVRTVEAGPSMFEVSSTEGDLFQKYADHFSAWGIKYVPASKANSTVLITVHTLPLLIAERCRLEPRVLIDLMRREIWSSEEEGRKSFQPKKKIDAKHDDQDFESSNIESMMYPEPTKPSTSLSWIQQMNGCPQGIVDLLNSRACRTAIMFNDPLNIEECQALLAKLALCAFPFQCAHGRPSMIPILDLRPLSDEAVSTLLGLDSRASTHDDYDGMDLDFAEAFRRKYIS